MSGQGTVVKTSPVHMPSFYNVAGMTYTRFYDKQTGQPVYHDINTKKWFIIVDRSYSGRFGEEMYSEDRIYKIEIKEDRRVSKKYNFSSYTDHFNKKADIQYNNEQKRSRYPRACPWHLKNFELRST